MREGRKERTNTPTKHITTLLLHSQVKIMEKLSSLLTVSSQNVVPTICFCERAHQTPIFLDITLIKKGMQIFLQPHVTVLQVHIFIECIRFHRNNESGDRTLSQEKFFQADYLVSFNFITFFQICFLIKYFVFISTLVVNFFPSTKFSPNFIFDSIIHFHSVVFSSTKFSQNFLYYTINPVIFSQVQNYFEIFYTCITFLT